MAESIRAIYLSGRWHDEASPEQRLASESEVLSVEEADTATGLERIESGTADCVLVDGSLLEATGADVVARVREIDPRIPVIVLTNSGTEPPESDVPSGVTDVVALSDGHSPASYHATRVENAAIRYRGRDATGAPATAGGGADDSAERSAHGTMPEQEEYERLFGAIDQSIFVTDAEGVYTYVNPEGAKITGYEPDEIVDERPDLLHPDEAEKEKVLDAVERLLADEDASVVTVDAVLERKDGEVVPIEAAITPRNSPSGEFNGVVGVVRDVTEERETEQRFRELKAIIRALPDEIVVHDTEGYIERVVPAVGREATASGYSLSEIKGMHLAELMDEEALEEAIEMITEIITGDRERATQEVQIRTKDGDRIWRESHFTTLEDDDGNIGGSVGVLRDIEERKAYERELERQNERLEEFASIASHDLRNPLNLAQGYMEMVDTECDTEHTAMVTDALDRMEKLIEDTLTWARQGRPSPSGDRSASKRSRRTAGMPSGPTPGRSRWSTTSPSRVTRAASGGCSKTCFGTRWSTAART